jgi:hypothetical protein
MLAISEILILKFMEENNGNPQFLDLLAVADPVVFLSCLAVFTARLADVMGVFAFLGLAVLFQNHLV